MAWTNVLLVAAARAITSAALWALGFRAVSDDDYARVVIAQRFAESPSWDPSGTSWLPLPFWISGGVMRLFGPELEIARATGLVCGVVSAGLVLLSARCAGLSRRAALAGTLIACCIPWFVWLGASTTPEALAAGLTLVGICSAGAPSPACRLLGAAALGLACWARYEAWPVSAVFAALCALDAARQRSWPLAACALVALAPACSWLVHGVLHHGDAWFFVQRVVTYRRALGGQAGGPFTALFAYPLRLAAAPELLLLLAGAAALTYRVRGLGAERIRRLGRPALLACCLLVFLVWGELRDGTATHHPERALLPIWLWLALLCGELVTHVGAAWGDRPRARQVGGGLAAIALGASLWRAFDFADESFTARQAEVAIGRAAAERAPDRAAPSAGGLLIDAQGFAYFAVMAGYARPALAAPLDDNDPRRPRQADLLISETALRARLRARRAGWLVVRRERAALARPYARERARNEGYVLFEVAPPGS